MTGLGYARCRSCSAEIIWAVTAGGKRMPLDAAPREDGNMVLDDRLTRDAPGVRRAEPADAGQRYVSHFITCPNAAEHRKGRAR